MRVIGSMTGAMVLVHLQLLMELFILATGTKIYSMVKVLKHGTMKADMKVPFSMETSTAKESSSGKTDQLLRVNLS